MYKISLEEIKTDILKGIFIHFYLQADPPSAHLCLSHSPVVPCKLTNQDVLRPEIYGRCFQPVRST